VPTLHFCGSSFTATGGEKTNTGQYSKREWYYSPGDRKDLRGDKILPVRVIVVENTRHDAGVTVYPTRKIGKFRRRQPIMKIKVIIHEPEEGGYWAEMPTVPACATQGETFEELLQNLYEAIEGCPAVDFQHIQTDAKGRIVEIAV
jgi:predicted RNase H-like HicB family nuclease